MRIAMCASEVVPFAKTGGLADVTGALPFYLEGIGNEVIVVMPGYKEVHNSVQKIYKLREDLSYAILGENIKVYFIENEFFFNRDYLYGSKRGDYKDNLKRFSYYCKKTLEVIKEINFKPDIIHCHDWQAALIPVYLKTIYNKDDFCKNTKTILTIHNLGYQGLFPKEEFGALGLDKSLFNMEALEFFGKINILKGGIVFSDAINTVSPAYSREIQTKELGFGLEGVLKKRSDSLFGILNGIDYSIWNPETDNVILGNYSISDITAKEKNKEVLQKICNFNSACDTPLIGVVSRLAEQKGLDLLVDCLEAICRMNLQLVILGTGDFIYHKALSVKAEKFPNCLALYLKFDNRLAHKIYAGSDIFLMPSKYEPCGLGQLISLRYGTIPVVFETGGLKDTVSAEYGFLFRHYNKDGLINSIKEALKAYKDKDRWVRLIENAMKCDFSWEQSAKRYIEMYREVLNC